MSLREAAQMALEALEQSRPLASEDDFVLLVRQHQQAITALRAALEQQEQEPVAWLQQRFVDNFPAPGYETCEPQDYGAIPVYTHPPRRETEQEPVGEVVCIDDNCENGPEAIVQLHNPVELGQLLYAYPPRREPEPVTWGVDWGRDGDRPCCTIIKRHADGTQEVVAVEYGPPRRETEQEPVAWSTQERFYEALDRAVGNIRQEMRIKTVTMRRKDHDVALPIIDACSGHVLVSNPPRREWQGLSDDDIAALYVKWDDTPGVSMAEFARAIEQALKERNNG